MGHEASVLGDVINLTFALFAGPGRKELYTLGGSQLNLLKISSHEHTEDIGSDKRIGVNIQYTAWNGHEHT